MIVIMIFFFDDRQVCKPMVKLFAFYTGKSFHTIVNRDAHNVDVKKSVSEVQRRQVCS